MTRDDDLDRLGRSELIAKIKRPPPLFVLGEHTLHSGATSEWKIDCDALTEADWECVAKIVRWLVGTFGHVEGVPRGGLALAEALEPYATGDAKDPWLLVDDVLTTGASMERHRADRHRTGRKEKGAVLFARGPCPDWVTPLFQYGARGRW